METKVSSATKEVIISYDRPTVIIGEHINPTGKKKLAEALKSGDLAIVKKEALEQVAAGATILDCNVNAPGVNDVKMLPEAIKLIQETVDVPLCIDSPNIDALEAGLKVYKGKALVNSVSGEKARLERVLPLIKHYGAAVIGLVGTLYYNRQEYALAERHYRSAIQIDPRYALAYFDLGNVLDETGRVEEAINTYKTAIQLAPTYADAHYNIALAYEKIREPRKALQHWRAYVKLDTTGPWTVHAKHRIQRILQGDSLKLVHSRKAN